MLRAGISSTIASFGIAPVPCSPMRPSNTRCGLSRSVVAVGLPTHVNGRFVNATTLPFPCVGACRMHGAFVAARPCLADLVCRYQQSLAMTCARGVKFKLLWIGLVVGEPVLS